MHAVVVAGPDDVSVRDVDRPRPGPDDLVVEVVAAAICATDRKFAARGDDVPRVLGHEFSGRLPDGTVVGVHPEATCGHCAACRAGWDNRCPERLSLGLGRDGGLAEAVVVPAAQVLPLAGIDPVVGSMLEPLACIVHAVEGQGMDTSSTAAVVGAGAMGILGAWVLQAAGVRVTVVQRSARRRELARTLGIDAVIGPDEDVCDTLGGPPGVALVTAPGAGALEWALHNVAPGGRVHAFAGTPGGALVDANIVHYRHLTLLGSTGSRFRDYVRARDLVRSGAVDLSSLPRHEVALADAADAVQAGPPEGALKTVAVVS